MAIKTTILHIEPVPLSLGLRAADDVTWKAISNEFDIDFIHGDIHGWSCKNVYFIIQQTHPSKCREPRQLQLCNMMRDGKSFYKVARFRGGG